jgi:hypothetical protein
MIEKDAEKAKKAISDPKILSELLEGILSKDDEVRYPSFKALFIISKEHPEVLYPKWDFFVKLISSYNSYKKLIGLRIIANLTKVDKENKFEKIFYKYYRILNDNRTMTAGHIASNSGKIAKAKPNLQIKITEKLLNIDKTHTGKQKELIKAYAIEAFDEYYEEVEDKKKINDFIKKQLESESPKTRKKAKEFLEKWKVK